MQVGHRLRSNYPLATLTALLLQGYFVIKHSVNVHSKVAEWRERNGWEDASLMMNDPIKGTLGAKQVTHAR